MEKNILTLGSFFYNSGFSKKILFLLFIILFLIGYSIGQYISLNGGKIKEQFAINNDIKTTINKNVQYVKLSEDKKQSEFLNNQITQIQQNVPEVITDENNELLESTEINTKTEYNPIIKDKKLIVYQEEETKTPKKIEVIKKVENKPKAFWEKNAIQVSSKPTGPVIAIIIDDMGADIFKTKQVLDIPAPITASFLSYAVNLRNQIKEAKEKGKEAMLHVPMEAKNSTYAEEKEILKTDYGDNKIKEMIRKILNKSPDIVGINNHMGSKFTEDYSGMQAVLEELKEKDLIFVDSKTTKKSVGERISKALNIPTVSRDIFLDNYPGEKEVEQQLAMLEVFAKKHGYSIAIGHPREDTINVLNRWVKTLKRKGITIVPVSYIVKNKDELSKTK